MKIKNKGAISIFALLSMMFFLIFVMVAYNSVIQKGKTQVETEELLVNYYKGSLDATRIKNSRDGGANLRFNALRGSMQRNEAIKIGSNGKLINSNGKDYTINESKEFQKVDYIQSSGTQVIDLGIKFNSNVDKFEIVYQANDANGNYFICGSGMYQAGAMWLYNYKNGDRISLYIHDSSASQKEFYGIAGSDANKHTAIYEGKRFYLDGSEKSNNISVTTFTETPYNFSLFNALNSSGFYAKTKIFSFKMWKSGVLVRNMIPCYSKTTVTNAAGTSCSSGTIGMYDTIEGKFYTNAGSGTFSKGGDV